MSEWKSLKLRDIAISIQPGPFGSQLHASDYSESGTPIIMPKDMIDGHISDENLSFIGDEHIQRLKRHCVYEGDLVFARKGDVRKCAYISSRENGWFNGSDCLKVVLDKTVCLPQFIYYQIKSPITGRYMETVAIGATMPSLNSSLLGSIPINLPPLDVQQHIVSILSAYDSLIKNNQRQIKLLEEAAQRLYKEWFVDLHFPGWEQTKIVDGVPEGWKVYSVKEMASILRRGISPAYDDAGKYWVINQKCIRQSIMDMSEARRQTKEYPLELNLQDSDVVICSTGTGTLGRVGQVYGIHENTTFDSHVTLVRAKKGTGKQFMYCALKEAQSFFMGMGRGSTNQQELYRGVIEEFKIVLPQESILAEFDYSIQTIHDQICTLDKEIALLIEIRDRLLPKLMSGEIAV